MQGLSIQNVASFNTRHCTWTTSLSHGTVRICPRPCQHVHNSGSLLQSHRVGGMAQDTNCAPYCIHIGYLSRCSWISIYRVQVTYMHSIYYNRLWSLFPGLMFEYWLLSWQMEVMRPILEHECLQFNTRRHDT